MWDSSKPSSTEIVPVLMERNAHSIFTTNCSFACSDFLMYYIVRMKSISLELEKQKTVKLLHYNFITIRFRSIWWRLREIENLSSWRSRHFTYLGVFLSNSLSICTSPKSTLISLLYTPLKTSRGINSKDNYKQIRWIERSLPWLSLMCVSLLCIDFNIHLHRVKDAHFSIFPSKLPYNSVCLGLQCWSTRFFVNYLLKFSLKTEKKGRTIVCARIELNAVEQPRDLQQVIVHYFIFWQRNQILREQ